MTTEYGRDSMGYGDFGCYTFQNALSDFGVDVDGLSNYAVEEIFKRGYKAKIFTEFDARQGSGRGGSYLERIGKKYQWITFYELLGRVSDHCIKRDPSAWEEKEIYSGPWEPYVRDIDPTIIIKNTAGGG